MKPWLFIVLIVATVLLALMLFRGCHQQPDHSGEAKALDSAHAVYVRDSAIMGHKNDSLVVVALHLKNTLTETLQALRATQTAVNSLQDVNTRLSSLILIGVDTPIKLKQCDSLAELNMAQGVQIHGLSTITDSLVAQQTRLNAVNTQRIVLLTRAVGERDTIINSQYKAYNALYKDYKKTASENKLNKTISRVLAVLLLIAAGASFSK